MSEETPCFFRDFCSSPCHQKSSHYFGQSSLVAFRNIFEEEREMLRRRTGIDFAEDALICTYHRARLISKLKFLQKSCCNPFDKDNHNKKKGLQRLSAQAAETLQELTKKKFAPGQKVCSTCAREARKRKYEEERIKELEQQRLKELEEQRLKELEEQRLKELEEQRLKELEEARVEQPEEPRVEEAEEAEADWDTLGAESGAGGGTEAGAGWNRAADALQNGEKVCQRCRDLETLLSELKVKFRKSDHSTRLQILTLAPSSWSEEKTAEEFEVSRSFVKQSRQLKMEGGVLAVPQAKEGKKFLDRVKENVMNFFDSDEFSRICPGKKEVVCVGKDGLKLQKQKRALLCNEREIYIQYTKKYGREISFSKFYELRPKWCIKVGGCKAHMVSVCTLHQNVKSMVAATSMQDDYKHLMKKAVCDIESKKCMLSDCDQCPGKIALKSYLVEVLKDHEPEETFEFKEWLNRGKLIARNLTTEELIEELTMKVFELKSHHFISKYQSNYLKQLKQTHLPNEIIIIMDFSENYSFLVQDASQAFHWNKTQATIHPIVVYVPGQTLQSLSLCMISDYLNHNVITVYAFQVKLIEHLKRVLGDIKRIHYFSEGTGVEYKNYKNFINLCFHEEDFGISAEWNFFGANHGKSSCDGIGGTVKRLATRASLQRADQDQILTPQDLFNFCDSNILGIKFFYVPREDIIALQTGQENRFIMGRTLRGTQQYHQIKPISKKEMKMLALSNDEPSRVYSVF